MSDFAIRHRRGQQVEHQIVANLENREQVVKVALNGTEHTHPGFVDLLRRLNSDAAKFVRYAPDGVMKLKDDRVIHFDVKYGTTIEKNAWQTYRKYAEAGCELWLVVYNPKLKQVYCQDIGKLILHNPHIEEAEKKRKGWKVGPIDKDGWWAPRLDPCFKPNSVMSGTPFRRIDFSSMVESDDLNIDYVEPGRERAKPWFCQELGCRGAFTEKVWHCAHCASHWPEARDKCECGKDGPRYFAVKSRDDIP